MKKLLIATALIASMATPAFAGDKGDWKERHQARMEEMLGKLPEAKRDVVKDTFTTMRESMKGNRDRMKSIKGDLETIWEAPEFDKAAFLAKLQEMDAAMQAGKADRHEAMAALGTQLTQEERQIVGDFVEKMWKRGGKHHGKHHDGGEGAAE